MPWTIGHDEPFDEPEPCEECDDEECPGCDGPDGDDYDESKEQWDHDDAVERYHAGFGPTGGPWE